MRKWTMSDGIFTVYMKEKKKPVTKAGKWIFLVSEISEHRPIDSKDLEV